MNQEKTTPVFSATDKEVDIMTLCTNNNGQYSTNSINASKAKLYEKNYHSHHVADISNHRFQPATKDFSGFNQTRLPAKK